MQSLTNLLLSAQIRLDNGALGIPRVNTDDNTIQGVLTTIFIVIGGISVLFVLIGGLRYAMSGGNATNTQQAKDTILYALIGVVVSVAATLIVQFVLGSLLA